MAYTFWRRTPRCEHTRCRKRAVHQVTSEQLAMDELLCFQHTLDTAHFWPGQVTVGPAVRRRPAVAYTAAHAAR